MKKIPTMLIILFFAATLHAEGLNTLIEVGKSMGEIAKESEAETKRFDAVKKGIQTGRIVKGQSRDSILKEYGEPVIEKAKTKREPYAMVYKPSSASFFEGIKIYLYFDDNGFLTDTKIVNQEPKKP